MARSSPASPRRSCRWRSAISCSSAALLSVGLAFSAGAEGEEAEFDYCLPEQACRALLDDPCHARLQRGELDAGAPGCGAGALARFFSCVTEKAARCNLEEGRARGHAACDAEGVEDETRAALRSDEPTDQMLAITICPTDEFARRAEARARALVLARIAFALEPATAPLMHGFTWKRRCAADGVGRDELLTFAPGGALLREAAAPRMDEIDAARAKGRVVGRWSFLDDALLLSFSAGAIEAYKTRFAATPDGWALLAEPTQSCAAIALSPIAPNWPH